MPSWQVGRGITHPIQITPLFFCRPAYFAQSFTGMKGSGLKLNSLYFFCRRYVEIVFYGF